MQINAKSILNALVSTKPTNSQTTELHAHTMTAEMAALVSGGVRDTYTASAIGTTQGPEWGDWIKK